jgi:stage V sporulation protein G
MKVTNVSVKLSPSSGDRLKAFCTMTLDDEFVVRDLKIIEGTSGLFVAMPSRKLTDHCPKCGGKNHLKAKFCNDCGARLPDVDISEADAQSKLHADVAHPINTACRSRLQDAILEAYREELVREGRMGEASGVAKDLGLTEADAPPPPTAPAQPEPAPAPEPEAKPAPENAAGAEPPAGEAASPGPTPEGPVPGADESAEPPAGQEEEEKGGGFGAGIL